MNFYYFKISAIKYKIHVIIKTKYNKWPSYSSFFIKYNVVYT